MSGNPPPPQELLVLLQSTQADDLKTAAGHPGLTEDLALALVRRRDLPAGVLEVLARNGRWMQKRELRNALVQHPRTPRHISLPLLRQFYTFDLMQVGLLPATPADVKRAAEDILLLRLPTLSPGERSTLAKQGSGRIAGALLNDEEKRVAASALSNPRITESLIVRALMVEEASPELAAMVFNSEAWTAREDIRRALLRNAYTSMAAAIVCAEKLGRAELSDILEQSHLPANIKEYLRATAARRERR